MNRFYFGLVICLLFSPLVNAQKIIYKNAIRIGADYMTLSSPGDVGMRYLVRYDRHFANDRIVLEGSIGYLYSTGPRQVAIISGQHRQRITGEITLLYDFLKSSTQALRLGVGPSIWNRQDAVLGVSAGATNDLVIYQIRENNVGAHAVIEYEYNVTSKISIAGRYGIAYFDRPGPSSMVGLNIGYHF